MVHTVAEAAAQERDSVLAFFFDKFDSLSGTVLPVSHVVRWLR